MEGDGGGEGEGEVCGWVGEVGGGEGEGPGEEPRKGNGGWCAGEEWWWY